MGAAGLRLQRGTAHGRKAQLDPGWRGSNLGEAARREAASLLATADRRMSKLRPGRVPAMPQSMRSRPRCEAHSDRLVEDEAQRSVRGVQRMRRSTPTIRRLPNGRSDQLRPSGGCPAAEGLVTPAARPGPRTKDQRQLRRLCPRCLRRAYHSASAAFPLGRPGESESSSGRTRATGTAHPGF